MTMAAQTVFITVPKFVTIAPGTLPKMKPSVKITASSLPMIRPASDDSYSVYSNEKDFSDGADEAPPRGKKRRLDHLTWEEKIQRKKLKNRVAAQTSRDRKKARMEEMEMEIKDLTQKADMLNNKCESLQSINDSLLDKNQKLDVEVQMLKHQLTELQKQTSYTGRNNTTTNTCAGCASINGSAVSNYTDPLPQGSTQMDSQSTQEEQKSSSSLTALWRIVALCLLYKTCCSSMKNSTPESWKNLPKACSQISQQKWMHTIQAAIKMLPKMQAAQSDCLDQWWGPQQSAWNPAELAFPPVQCKIAT